MKMLFYGNVKTNPVIFTSFTGLSVAEFEDLLPHFEKAWEAHREECRVTAKERHRKAGGGAVPTTLRTAEDRLFFYLGLFQAVSLASGLGIPVWDVTKQRQ